MPKPPPFAQSELHDLPRCGVCHWRHDPPECRRDRAPVPYLGEVNGRPMWGITPYAPTKRGGRRIGHVTKEEDLRAHPDP